MRSLPPGAFTLVFALLAASTATGRQDPTPVELIRPPAPPLEDFESDVDGDGVPDGGWYNLRDASREAGGLVGPTLIRFKADKPSRAARMSRGFGVDGREVEALIVGLWVRQTDLLPGERIGEEPGLMIDFLDADLKSTARGMMGSWSRSQGDGWVLWKKRMHVPPATRDAILTVGLLGGTGTLDIDGLTIEPVPIGGASTTNLIVNGDFELGGKSPEWWAVEGETGRTFPGSDSESAVTLSGWNARAIASVGVPIRGVAALNLKLRVRAESLRGSGGAQAGLFFLDIRGDRLPGDAGGVRLFRWSGTFPWKTVEGNAPVPAGAFRAVLQIEMTDSRGSLTIDRVEVTTRGDSGLPPLNWTPFHEAESREGWVPYAPAEAIAPGTALDASRLLDAPAGRRGFVVARAGRLAFSDGSPARFLGVSLFPPLAFASPEEADRLADRLASSGVNLVRLGDLDSPLGLGTSLLDDAADNTSSLDPASLANLDHLIAALKKRGIYIALEFQAQARLREQDGLPDPRMLGAGGGPAVAFHPVLRKRLIDLATQILEHMNPETGLPLIDDPALVWVTLAGELSLFDLIDDPERLPQAIRDDLREEITTAKAAAGRKGWQRLEQEQWGAVTKALRREGLKSLVAGSSHWRREGEYVAAQTADPLNLVDDRLFWYPARYGDPRFRSALFDLSPTGLSALADRKKRADRPYVVGQYASYTFGAPWLPAEGPDLILAATLASRNGWDALVRRGVARFPTVWGTAPTGTGGGPDVFSLSGAFNGNPQVFSLLPHAASILIKSEPASKGANASRALPGWDALSGHLKVDQPLTQGAAGRLDARPMTFRTWTFDAAAPSVSVLLSSLDGRPIDSSARFLLTAVGRCEPTGLEWVEAGRREVADPGRAPILIEPTRLSLTWTRPGTWSIHPLDAAGNRLAPIPITRDKPASLGAASPAGTIHWEIIETEQR